MGAAPPFPGLGGAATSGNGDGGCGGRDSTSGGGVENLESDGVDHLGRDSTSDGGVESLGSDGDDHLVRDLMSNGGVEKLGSDGDDHLARGSMCNGGVEKLASGGGDHAAHDGLEKGLFLSTRNDAETRDEFLESARDVPNEEKAPSPDSG